MKRKLFLLLLLSALMTGLIPAQAFAIVTEEAIVQQSVNFRTGPSTNDSRIRYLKPGEVLNVIQRVNDYWLYATDQNGQAGYVTTSEKYIELKTTELSPQLIGEIISSVSFRTGPSTNDSRIRYLQRGEHVEIIEEINAYWYKVADENNVIGYVSSKSQYIDVISVPDNEPEEPTYIDKPNAVVVSSVSFRTGPSTNNSRIRYLKTGESLWILDKVNSYWYKAKDSNDVVGYVSTSSKYVDTTYTDSHKLLEPAVAAERIIEAGMKYLGTPYEFGSDRSNTSTFDCSDFVRQAFLDGIKLQLPGNSRSQAIYVKEIGKTSTDWRSLKRGDLMFFMSYRGYKASDYANIDKSTQTVTHVGIYLGDGQILHTYSQKSGGVIVMTFAGTSWEYRFLFGGSAQ